MILAKWYEMIVWEDLGLRNVFHGKCTPLKSAAKVLARS